MIRKILSIVMLALTVVWMIFIFSNSADTAQESTDKSQTVTEIVNEVIEAVGGEEITEKEVRKSAHFFEYAVLCALLCCDVYLLFYTPKYIKSPGVLLGVCACVIAGCALIAIIDEMIIQKSSHGRGPDIADVALDTSGAVLAYVLFCIAFVLSVLIKKYKQKKCDSNGRVR